MKSIIFVLVSAFSLNAFSAELPVHGIWYNAYKQLGENGYFPESMTTISSDGLLKWEIQFPESKQKQIVIFKAVVTESTIQAIEILSQTNCNTTMVSDSSPRAYRVEGDKLTLWTGVELNRATNEQKQKFASLTEGCN